MTEVEDRGDGADAEARLLANRDLVDRIEANREDPSRLVRRDSAETEVK